MSRRCFFESSNRKPVPSRSTGLVTGSSRKFGLTPALNLARARTLVGFGVLTRTLIWPLESASFSVLVSSFTVGTGAAATAATPTASSAAARKPETAALVIASGRYPLIRLS
jgi:hypothetical protein